MSTSRWVSRIRIGVKTEGSEKDLGEKVPVIERRGCPRYDASKLANWSGLNFHLQERTARLGSIVQPRLTMVVESVKITPSYQLLTS